MLINTRDFGQIDINEDEIIRFPEGLYGFPHVTRYVILRQDDEDSPVLWLQSVEDTFPSFVIMDAESIVDEYKVSLPKKVLETLETNRGGKLQYFVIAVIPKDIKDMTVNMKSPIVVNFEGKVALQVILEDSAYQIRHRVFEDGKVLSC